MTHHVLHIKYDDDDLECSVTCPHDPTDFDRPCVMYYECGCQPEDPYEADGSPCSASPTGNHELIAGASFLCHPSTSCFVAENENLHDAVLDLQPYGKDLLAGDYPVTWVVREFEYFELRFGATSCVVDGGQR